MPHPSLWLLYHKKGLYATLSTGPTLDGTYAARLCLYEERHKKRATMTVALNDYFLRDSIVLEYVVLSQSFAIYALRFL